MPRLLAAPDKFRGTASAPEVAAAAARGAQAAGWEATTLPMADGGEGTLDVLGGRRRRARVSGPLGGPVEAEWRMLDGLPGLSTGPTAVVEMARASGLALVGGAAGNDPMTASTAGTGQLVAAAVAAGARTVVVAVGGSATTDGGWGAVEVLARGSRLAGVEVVVACDVDTRFTDAAATFAPQKGATPAQVSLLTRRLERLAQLYEERYGVDVRHLPGSGAAGGLAGGLAALGARLVPGFELVAEAQGLASQVGAADLVLTGEGYLDAQSFRGKVVGGVLERARAAGRPALVVVGDADPALLVSDQGPPGRLVSDPEVVVVRLAEAVGLDASLADPLRHVEQAVARHLGGWR